MEAFSEYLIKSAAWITGFALVYLLFLRNERFFNLKRIYLLSGILISLIFPLISVHYQVEVPAPSTGSLSFQGTEFSSVTAGSSVSTETGLNYKMILFVLYITGVLFLGYRIIRHLIWIKKTISKANINNIGPARLVRISSFPASFSFFNYVFINPSVDEAEVREIMNHELVHVNQKHWLDLFLIETLRLLQWVNPFVWIYTGFVRLNNEYLADEMALQRSSNPAIYKAALLNQLFRSPVISLTNSFNYSLNQKRFDMMKKIITSPYRKLKVLLVLPVFAIILYAFATPKYSYLPSDVSVISPLAIKETQTITQNDVIGIVLTEDGKPLSMVTIAATPNGIGTQTGSDGRFYLTDISKDASLLVSCIGYKNQTLKPDFTSEIVIKMVKDPEYKMGVMTPDFTARHEGENVTISMTDDKNSEALIVINDKITDYKGKVTLKRDDIVAGKVLRGKEATDKYGEKGKNGVIVLTTKNHLQKVIKGVVVTKDGKPLEGVLILNTGTSGLAHWTNTKADGTFTLADVPDDERIYFSLKGYKPFSTKPVFTSEMKIILEVDPDFNSSSGNSYFVPNSQIKELVVVDGVISEKSFSEVMKELGYNMGPSKALFGKDATDKYGEKAVNGVREITTRKKAIEMGQKVPLPKLAPSDYPTFQGQRFTTFTDWVCNQAKYPAEATAKKIEGWVSVNFSVELNGTISNIKSTLGDPLLAEEVIRVIKTSPRWDPPKNPEVDSPHNSTVTLKFKLPDQVLRTEPFVVVEQMPMYPGGDAALLDFLKNNTKYPEEAKVQKIEGRVIVRFIVGSDGYVGGVSVLKGVHTLLDAEAIRVVGSLEKFTPGMQGGNPVDVWYMCPVTFSLPKTDPPQ